MFLRQIFLRNQHFLLLLLLFGIVNVLLYLKLGVRIANDSFRYQGYAELMMNQGTLYQPHNFWYISYVLFTVATKFVSDQWVHLVLFQIALSAVSIAALYHFSRLLFNDKQVAFLTAALYLSFFEISSWNFYILVESFYASILCICLYCIANAYFKTTLPRIALATFTTLVALFTKPTGIALLAGILVFFAFLKWEWLKKFKWVNTSLFLLVVVLGFFLLNKMLESFTLIENYQLGEIVFGITTLPNYPSYDLMVVEVPQAVKETVAPNLSPIPRTITFFIEQPLFFLKLCFLKLLWYLAHIKPYYSWLHNFYIAGILYPMYIFYCHSLTKKSAITPLKILFTTLILFNCLIVSLTSEDWDGRFIIPILPPLFVLGTKGLVDFAIGIKKRNEAAF